MMNFEVAPAALAPYMPGGVELDSLDGRYFVSLVALQFTRSKVFGLIPTIPFSFVEVNLRFYVKRAIDGETRRGVVFIREIVPSRLIATVARALYNEPYTTCSTSHSEQDSYISYSWQASSGAYTVACDRAPDLNPIMPGSPEDFFLERYWGYTPQPDGSTFEYRVTHEPWRYWHASRFTLNGDLGALYGEHLRATLSARPFSVIVAQGSVAEVSTPRKFFAPLSSDPPVGWALFDGSCGLCSSIATSWSNTVRRCGFEFAPNDAPWIRDRFGPWADTLAEDMRLLLHDGRLLSGADAYIFLMRRIWWLRPVAYLLGLPLIRYLTRWLY